MTQEELNELFIKRYIEFFESTREMAEFALEESGTIHSERTIEYAINNIALICGL